MVSARSVAAVGSGWRGCERAREWERAVWLWQRGESVSGRKWPVSDGEGAAAAVAAVNNTVRAPATLPSVSRTVALPVRIARRFGAQVFHLSDFSVPPLSASTIPTPLSPAGRGSRPTLCHCHYTPPLRAIRRAASWLLLGLKVYIYIYIYRYIPAAYTLLSRSRCRANLRAREIIVHALQDAKLLLHCFMVTSACTESAVLESVTQLERFSFFFIYFNIQPFSYF